MEPRLYAQCRFRCAKVGGGDYIAEAGEEIDVGKIRLHPQGDYILKRLLDKKLIGETKPEPVAPTPAKGTRARSETARRAQELTLRGRTHQDEHGDSRLTG